MPTINFLPYQSLRILLSRATRSMLELHIWGPAFGLPSIDPECLAAISYLRCIPELNPSNAPKGWRIVPSGNVMLSPSRTLPTLRDRHVWIGGGFTGIVDYLRKKSNGEWDLDRPLRYDHDHDSDGEDYQHNHNHDGLPSYTWSESVAYSSFIRARLGPLVDISLYISQVNYENVTRPEFSKKGMLPWPTQFWVPGDKRAAAWQRCAPVLRKCGLSAGDVDPPIGRGSVGGSGNGSGGVGALETPAVGQSAVNAARGGIHGFGNKIFGSAGGKQTSAATTSVVFKLQTLITRNLTPVAARLVSSAPSPTNTLTGGNQKEEILYFFKCPNPTSIDCLILGYLCLCIYPALPNPFLRQGICELDGGRGGKRVYTWVEQFRARVFGKEEIDARKILDGISNAAENKDRNGNNNNGESQSPSACPLPWEKPERADLPWLTSTLASAAKDYFTDFFPSWVLKRKSGSPPLPKDESPDDRERRERIERAMRRDRVAKVVTLVAGLGGFLWFLFGTGVVRVEVAGGDGVVAEIESRGEEDKDVEVEAEGGGEDEEGEGEERATDMGKGEKEKPQEGETGLEGIDSQGLNAQDFLGVFANTTPAERTSDGDVEEGESAPQRGDDSGGNVRQE